MTTVQPSARGRPQPREETPAQPSLGASFARYVPELVVDRLLRRDHAVDGPTLERFDCAVMFADISGFTPLTETFAAQGPAGAETLTRILNDYFGRLIDLTRAHGGDTVKFAGDAMTVIWRDETSDLTSLTRRAAQCALAIQADVRGYTAHGHTLSLRVAVGCGSLSIIHIGGEFSRWEFAIAGEPLHQVGHAGRFAEPGEVVVSQIAWEHLEAIARGRRRADQDSRDVVWLDSVQAFAPQPLMPSPTVPERLEAALRGYLPAAITRRIMAGQTGFLGELRTLTILFINLPDMHYDTPLELGQRAMRALQQALYFPYEGSINKLSVDDKGVTLIACLGMPPFSHEDDAVRGPLAAIAMRAALEGLGQRCSIGVTTGRVYCGSVGSSLRQEYTIMGDKVNLSARLMQAAAGGILADADTVNRSRTLVRYGEVRRITVKGKAQPLDVYEPLGAAAAALPGSSADNAGQMIGRQQELAALTALAEAVIRDGASHTVIIEGEAGVGKSRLLSALLDNLEWSRCRVLRGAGDAIKQQTPWFAWQHVLADLLRFDRFEGIAARREHVQNLLVNDRDNGPLAPLLNAIVPLELPDTELTRQMSGDVRAGNTRRLIQSLLSFSATRKPLVLVIDDVHWMDASSWALVQHVVHSVQPMLTVLLTRPMQQRVPSEYALLLAGAARHIKLDRMTPEETVQLAQRRLGVDQLPPLAAGFIRERAEGHPFFAEEIALALRDSGALNVLADGTCEMAEGVTDLASLNLPGTVEGIITSRIDRLDPQQQLSLKVASVIGRSFSTELLQDVYPVPDARAELPAALGALHELDLTSRDAPAPLEAWSFNHVITQQVAYDLMLYAQRKSLHESIARWYEARDSDDLASYSALLAHHWGRAEDTERQLHYLELAAEEAVRGGANREALDFVHAIEALVQGDEDRYPVRRQAHWYELAGEALRSLGRLPDARIEFARALRLLGYPVPQRTTELVPALLREFAVQAKHRLVGIGRRALSDAEREETLYAASIWDRLFLVYFFDNDIVSMLHVGLVVTNLAERLGTPCAPLVRGYVCLAFAFSAIPRPQWVDWYEARALEVLAEIGDNLAITAWADMVLSAVRAGDGRWDEIEFRSQEALAITRQLGDHRGWEEAAANLALIRTLYGYIVVKGGLHEEVLASGKRRESAQAESWGYSIGAINSHMSQDLESLDGYLDAYAPILARGEPRDPVARLEGVSLLAQRAIRNDDAADTERYLQEGMALITEIGRPAQYRYLPAAQQLTEATLESWRNSIGTSAERGAFKRVRTLHALLKTYASVFPIGDAKLAWLDGKIAWYRGAREQALEHWDRSNELARGHRLGYEELLANATLARYLPPGDLRDQHQLVTDQLTEELGIGLPLEIPHEPPAAS